VEALAGTGKTTTAVELTKKILNRNPSSKILYITFSKKAATDIRAR
jgi:ATP-dependent exoDNAse (exonuclease V) beta subunit